MKIIIIMTAGASEACCATRVTNEGNRVYDVLHGVPPSQAWNGEARTYGSSTQSQNIVENLVDRLNLNPSDRGKVEALRSLGRKFSDLGEWIKSCRHLPTYTRSGHAPKARIILATDG